MRDGITHIVNVDQYLEFCSSYPEYNTINRDLFNYPGFIALTINPTADKPQWKMTFEALDLNSALITEKQAVQYMMMYVGRQLDMAEANLEPWPYCEKYRRLKGADQVDCFDFYRLVYGFMPANSDLTIIKDAFYRRMVGSSDGWRDDSRNFLNSKVAENVMHFDKVKKYESIQPGKREYSESEIAALNEQYYKEEVADRRGRMGTPADRAIVAEKVAKRLLEETGHVYSMTSYDLESSWMDNDAFEMCKMLVPDFWKALLKLLTDKSSYFNDWSDCAADYAKNTEEMVGLDFKPNSQSAMTIMQSELASPLAHTRQYINNVRRGINNFIEQFHIDRIDNITDDYLYGKIELAVDSIDDERGAEFHTFYRHLTVQSLVLYFRSRCRTLQYLTENN